MEDAPSATWVEHALVRRHGRHFPDYYILFSPLPHLPTHHTTTPTTPPTIPPVPYSSHTSDTTPNPYTRPPPQYTEGPYNPYTWHTQGPYDPYTRPQYTQGPHNPYTRPTPDPYTPITRSTATPRPYDLYTVRPSRYVRSAYPPATTDVTGAIFRVVMRGSAVAAANITCFRS